MDRARVPRVRAALRTELLDDELLLYSESETRIVALNPTASLIWALIDGERPLGGIEKLLVEAYPEAAGRIPADLDSIVGRLVAEGVLTLEPGPQART